MMSEKKKAGKVTDILRVFICGLAIWGIFFSGLLASLDDPLAEPEPVKVDTRTQAEKIADQFSTHVTLLKNNSKPAQLRAGFFV
jgi:hypothetical protein